VEESDIRFEGALERWRRRPAVLGNCRVLWGVNEGQSNAFEEEKSVESSAERRAAICGGGNSPFRQK
jgi:hypothetical protein